ncbi:hypothetical protein [Sphingomonas sp.]|uniref:hypothetical protein n=1 Tax=Sphingomonas sp. TaxID=28214 RepID=UPI002DD65B9A|nr:hypothetical protein [Sphingomonas sp.]
MRYLIPIALLALAACGSRGELKPAPGGSLPVKPYGATATPTPSQLMEPAPQARPERKDELLKSSEERPRDDFDLPPTR